MLELMLRIQMIITLFLYQKYKNKTSWIAVADALPEKYKKVIIFYDRINIVEVAIYKKGRWTINGIELEENVTHWQPLPEPPK